VKPEDFKFKEIFYGKVAYAKNFSDPSQNILSVAALDLLKDLIPTEALQLDYNPDLLAVAYNAAVPNAFNKNGIGIAGKDLIAAAPFFKLKPNNIEHVRSRVIGHTVNYGFSAFESSALLTEEEAFALEDPFNLSLASVIYKLVDKKFAALVEESVDPSSQYFGVVSASWEMLFSNFAIALGSDLLKECEIITDAVQIKELSPFLKKNGGAGVLKDGTKAHLLVLPPVLPIGIGYTMTPAAQVKGLFALLDEDEDENDDDETNEEDGGKIEISSTKTPVDENTSQINTIIVNTTNDTSKTMDLEQFLAKIETSLAENKLSKETVASMTQQFANAIKERDEEYKREIEAAKNKEADLAAERDQIKADLEATKASNAEIQKRLDELDQKAREQEALASFNSRMQQIDDEFVLGDSERQVIGNKVKTLDSDETFASYFNELKVLLGEKTKAAVEAKEKEQDEKIKLAVEEGLKKASKTVAVSTASTEEPDVKAALAKAETNTTATVPNNVQTDEAETVFTRYQKAFETNKENFVETK
jgi:hypothetical protein